MMSARRAILLRAGVFFRVGRAAKGVSGEYMVTKVMSEANNGLSKLVRAI
jgi:hypothetical protein